MPSRRFAPLPQVDGTLDVGGLRQPVSVIRDRWGIPHITAQNEHDLFFAQGFVQAQDRLFQMDLWRRSAQGRLAQVLGSNFVDRDVMTARVQYHGDLDLEWASYPSGTKAIAEAFVTGVNAWVVRARAQLPDEFVLAGWIPDLWTPRDVLTRTDAFLASGDAALQALRAQLIAHLERAIFKPLFAIFPGAPFIHVAVANPFQRPPRAARDVIGAGIGDFGVPRLVDLPQPPAFSSVAGGVGVMLRLVRDDPIRNARIYARILSGALNVRPNGEPPARSDRTSPAS